MYMYRKVQIIFEISNVCQLKNYDLIKSKKMIAKIYGSIGSIQMQFKINDISHHHPYYIPSFHLLIYQVCSTEI